MNSLTVQIIRGKEVESVHAIDGIVVHNSGKIFHEFGQAANCIFPRSAIKSLQALPLFYTGADQKFNLDQQEIALACASHTGQKIHTDKVSQWLKRMGLSVLNLECGSHFPYDKTANEKMILSHEKPNPVHNNCSGKHTGMLAVALQLHVPTKGYIQLEHAVQQLVLNTLKEICDLNDYLENFGLDGCSIPTHYMPLKNLALGMSRLAAGFQGQYVKPTHCNKIFQACVNEPLFMSGEGEYCYNIMKHLNKKALVKVGAEGVMAAAIPDQKLGVMLKVRDGNERAASLAMSLVLEELGLLPKKSEFTLIEIKNRNGIATGQISGQITTPIS